MDKWTDSAECCNFLPLTVVVKFVVAGKSD